MNFIKTKINGFVEINNITYDDERGYLFKFFDNCINSFIDNKSIKQINFSSNFKKGTIRGLHYQNIPMEEFKIITCISGKVFDVCIDLRRDSSSYMEWEFIILDSQKKNSLIIPEGCAHGFQTLEDNSQLLYAHTGDYAKEYENGIRFDDDQINIKWPLDVTCVSTRDLNLKYFR